MPLAIHVPRINNNDDEVKLAEVKIAIGQAVAKGQVIASVETDKAVVDVEAPHDGWLLAMYGEPGAMVGVGSVLAWLGASADEDVPAAQATSAPDDRSVGRPTAKAQALLSQHGLKAGDVKASGNRLSVADIERHLEQSGAAAAPGPAAAPGVRPSYGRPVVQGTMQALRMDQKGMLATVQWHRDVAVSGYIELPYEVQDWDGYAADFQARHKLMLNPLLALMAWRLVRLVHDHRAFNATIVGDQRWEYDQVNLGFTVQAGEVLYLAVTQGAQVLSDIDFVNQLVDLQRRAASHALGPRETQGTTVGFSSMARWKVSRHIPVLAPHTSLMVAHAAGRDGRAVLGASYDHRVLHGADVVGLLRKLSKPA